MAINKISEEIIEIRLEGADGVISGYAKVNKAAEDAADGQSDALNRQAKEDDRIQRKLTAARIAAIKDRNKREIAFLRSRHVEEMRRAKRHGANLNKLRKAQAQERSNLINRQVTRDAEIQKRANEKAAKSADVAVGGLSRLQAKLVAFGGAAQTFETGMRVAGAAMRALSQPIDLATTFEREFNLVRTLSDDVTTSTRQNLLDLASQVPQTQIEIARSAYNALSRGVSEADLISFLRTASQAATAGNTDLVTASDSLLKSLGAFGTKGETVASIGSKIFTTVKLAATNFNELNASLGQGLAVSSYGVKLQELLAIAGTLTKTLGVNFSEAIVRTNALMNVVTGATKKNQDALKAIGVEYGVSAIRAKGLAAVLADLREKTQGSAAALNNLSGNQRARQGLLGILEGTNYEELTGFLEEVRTETDGLGKAQRKVAGDAQAARDQFKSLSESVLRDLGEAVLPHLNKVMQELGDYLKDNRTEIVGTFKEVADAVVSLGRFLVTNGDNIVTLVKSIFAFQVVNSFTAAVGQANKSLSVMGATGGASFVSRFAGGLRALPGLGLIASAGLVIYDVIKSSLFDSIDEDVRRVQRDIAASLRQAAQARGFASQEERKRATGRVQSGEALGFGRGGTKATIVTPEEFLQRQTGDLDDRIEKLQAEVEREVQLREKLIEKTRSRLPALRKARSSAQARGVRGSEFVRADAALQAADDEIGDLEQANINILDRANKTAQKALLKRDLDQAELAADRRKKATESRNKKAEAIARRAAAKAQRRQEGIARSNLELVRRREDAEVAAIEDANTRKLIAQNNRHDREYQAAEKAGTDLNLLFKAQAKERENLERQIAKDKAEKAKTDSQERFGLQLKSAMGRSIARGDFDKAESIGFVAQQEQQALADQAELERARQLGLDIEDIEKEQQRRRIAVFKNFQAQRERLEADTAGKVADSMGSLFGSVKALGQAVGASESVIGKLEGMILLSRAALHTASGFGELANAASAAAGLPQFGFIPNPALAAAHKIAAASHFVAATASTVQAGVSFGIGGGGGGGATASPAASPAAPVTGQASAPLQAREQRAAISFGDIHLSSIPSMLSRDGASEMGRLIARDVAKELRQRANLQGTARLPQRVIRRS